MEKSVFKPEKLDVTIKRKPKEDPVGLFLDKFGKVLGEDYIPVDKIDISHLNSAQQAESLWSVFKNIVEESIFKFREKSFEKLEPKEKDKLRLSLGVVKNLYDIEEVRTKYLGAYAKHMQEAELINGDLEKYKILGREIMETQSKIDLLAKGLFVNRRKDIEEIEVLLFEANKIHLDDCRREIKELLDLNPELGGLEQYQRLTEYNRQYKKSNFMWLPSRRRYLEEMEKVMISSPSPAILFPGESGGGKTSLIKQAALIFTNKPCLRTAGKNTRLERMIAERDIMPDGTPYYRYKEIGIAVTGKRTTLEKKGDDGGFVLDDEFNQRDVSDQVEILSAVNDWLPGETVTMPTTNEDVTVKQKFLFCAPVNLYEERKKIPPEVLRKFNHVDINYLEQSEEEPEIYESMLAALLDKNGRVRAIKKEIEPHYEYKEESRTVIKDGQKISQTVRLRELVTQIEENRKIIMVGGFLWRFANVLNELNKSRSRDETVLKSKGEGQFIKTIIIDIGRVLRWLNEYLSFGRAKNLQDFTLEDFIINKIKKDFLSRESFSLDDRQLVKEFLEYYDIDVDKKPEERATKEFEIMTTLEIGLLSPRVKYEKVVKEEPFITESYYLTSEGEKVKYRIEKFGQGADERIPGEIYLDTKNNAAIKFLGVNKETGSPVYEPYKKGVKKAETYKKEVFSPIAKAKWKNPETQKEQEIKINFVESLAEQKVFYKDKLNLKINEAEVRSIWEKNYAEIKAEIEKYGYDKILIVPDNLPGVEVLNQKLIESMEETVGSGKKKVAATHQGDNFQNGGSFAGVRNSEQPKYRIILTHSEQNIYNNPAANPYLKATLGKDIMELTGLDSAEVEERITGNQEMTVDFKAIIKGQEVWIQSEGGSLGEYMLQQAMYFKKTGKHLDEDGWTWLLKSRSGSRVVYALWYPGARQLGVFAVGAARRDGDLGLRLSRSFSS